MSFDDTLDEALDQQRRRIRRIGDSLVVAVAFDGPVFVGDAALAPADPPEPGATPAVVLDVGGEARQAGYLEGAGTDRLRFVYVVAAADRDRDGVEIAADSIALNGATIRDAAGVDAVLAHAPVQRRPDRLVDGVRPAPAAMGAVAVAGTTVLVGFDERLDRESTPPPGAFEVAGSAGNRSVAAVAIGRSSVKLTLASPVHPGETDLAVHYAPPVDGALRDLAGMRRSRSRSCPCGRPAARRTKRWRAGTGRWPGARWKPCWRTRRAARRRSAR